jgi:hypothetical protein
MKLIEVFSTIDEIAFTKLNQSSTWRAFDHSPAWDAFQLLPRKFLRYDVLLDASDSATKWFVIVDPKRFVNAKKNGPRHQIKDMPYDIPSAAVVGGIDITKVKGKGPAGKAWKVDYLAFSPVYQGMRLPLKFYKWLLVNYDVTGVGAIKAGELQTPGSQKLWANLTKSLMVFAYDPQSKTTSQVEIGDDGQIEGKFDVYPENSKEIMDMHKSNLKLLKQQLRDKEIDIKTYNKEEFKINRQLDQEFANRRSAFNAELYAVLPIDKKPKKKPTRS